MDARNARDVQRANNWKKTVERKEVNWQLTNLSEYRKAANERGGPDDDSPIPCQEGAGDSKGTTLMSNRMKRRMARNLMLQALNDVHEIFEEIADLMLLKVHDMDAVCNASVEWCKTFEHIRRGELRDDEIDKREEELRQKAHK